MWSLGCLAAALLVGNLLYSGQSDYDIVRAASVRGLRWPLMLRRKSVTGYFLLCLQMRQIVQMQGYPSNQLLSVGTMTGQYFKPKRSSSTTRWKLKVISLPMPVLFCRQLTKVGVLLLRETAR